MSMTIYAGKTEFDTHTGREIFGPVHGFNCADATILAEDCDARAERGEDPFVKNPDYIEGAFMTLANANARFLFETLGFDLGDEGIATLPLDEVQAAALKGLNGGAAMAQRPATHETGAGGMEIFGAALPSEQMCAYLGRLLHLAHDGRQHGATHVFVG